MLAGSLTTWGLVYLGDRNCDASEHFRKLPVRSEALLMFRRMSG